MTKVLLNNFCKKTNKKKSKNNDLNDRQNESILIKIFMQLLIISL